MYETNMIADSVGPNGVRLSTMTTVTWKPLIGEFNTHKVLSRNSVSSRAKSFKRQLIAIQEKPHVPVFQRNTKEMQPGDYFTEAEQMELTAKWLEWRDSGIAYAQWFDDYGVHKQWVNRPLEAWMESEVLVSATCWDSFINLRVYGGAQTEMRETARAVMECLESNTPQILAPGDWHLPFTDDVRSADAYLLAKTTRTPIENEGDAMKMLAMVSAGRAATVSYDNLGAGRDMEKDYERATRLVKAGHWSCFEHQGICMRETGDPLGWQHDMMRGIGDPKASAASATLWSGNFQGWVQFRKTFKGEFVWQPEVHLS